MKIFFPEHHAQHHPQKDYSDGLPALDHPEVPQRLELLRQGFQQQHSLELVRIKHLALAEGRQLHDADYIDFLLAIGQEIKLGNEYLPPIFRNDLSKAPIWFRGGMYCSEVGTPIGPKSINAALNSAASAHAAANHLLATQEDVIALCRPPGHHAGQRRYGGYCFFNNAYLAAQTINQAKLRCAVLDLDYHLGDGSLEFATQAAPYFSLHADPYRNYPYLDKNALLDKPHITLKNLPKSTDGAAYLQQVTALLDEMQQAKPDIIILSLGFDTLGTDGIQDEHIDLKPEDYTALGKCLGKLTPPLLILSEGGYDQRYLSRCAENFLAGFKSERDK